MLLVLSSQGIDAMRRRLVPPVRPVPVVYPSARRLPAKTRAFIDLAQGWDWD